MVFTKRLRSAPCAWIVIVMSVTSLFFGSHIFALNALNSKAQLRRTM